MTYSTQILMIDKDPAAVAAVKRQLADLGYGFHVAQTSPEVRAALGEKRFDAMVVAEDCFHWATPGLREYGLVPFAPVLMLGCSRHAADFERARRIGVSGWIGKPFTPLEVRVWISCLVQRKQPPVVREVAYADVVLDLDSYEAWIGHAAVTVTRKEFAVLRLFMEHPGRILTANFIWEEIWGRKRKFLCNLIHVYVNRVRAKLAAHSERTCLRTFRGRGYALFDGDSESLGEHGGAVVGSAEGDDNLVTLPAPVRSKAG